MLAASSPATTQAWMQTSAYTQESQDFSFPPTVARYNGPAQLSQLDVSQETTELPPLVTHILSYAYGVVVPTTWPNESGRAKWTYEIARTWEDISAIKQDSCYASASLCFFATLMAAATNNKDIASQACFFQVQAMTELRRKLSVISQGSDQLTLKAILKLFSAETALDNTAAARVHLKMLRTFIGAKGGIIMLDPWLRENLLATDCYFALKYETRPLFPVSEWTLGPLSQPWKSQLAQAGLSDDHLPNVDGGIEHINVRSIISDLRELFRVELYINTHDVAAEDQLLRWRLLRKYDCVNRLADHQLSLKIYPHLYSRPRLQLATCAAVALMTAMVLGCPEPVRSGLKLLAELRARILEARAESETTFEGDKGSTAEDIDRVMLWMLYVGNTAEQVHPVPEYSIWFATQFDTLARQLNRLGLESQRHLFKGILFSKILAEEIHHRRLYRTSESRRGVYEACGMSWRTPLESVEQGQPMVEEDESSGKGKEKVW